MSRASVRPPRRETPAGAAGRRRAGAASPGGGVTGRTGTPTGAGRQPVGIVGTVLLVAAALGVLALTAWGLTSSLGAADGHAVADGWVDAGPAVLRVESTVARDTGHTMPGMDQNLADPVPPGFRRLSATVTLEATEPGGVQLAGEDFTVAAPGIPPTQPTRAQLGDGALAEGAAATVELIFDVPETTESGLVLTYRDARVPLADLGPVPAPGTHGDAPAPGTHGDAPAPGTHGDAPPAPGAPTEAPTGPGDVVPHPDDGHEH